MAADLNLHIESCNSLSISKPMHVLRTGYACLHLYVMCVVCEIRGMPTRQVLPGVLPARRAGTGG